MTKVVINTSGEGNEGANGNIGTPSYISPEELAAKEANKDKETPAEDNNAGNNNDNKDVITIGDSEYVVDENGNALNEDGTVFKTKAELEDVEPTKKDDDSDDESKVEIDGKIYTINKDGAAVSEDGTVAFTKDELSEMDDEPISNGIPISELIEKTSIVPYDKTGNPIKYEDTEEGKISYVKDVYNTGKTTGINELFTAFPEVQQLALHLEAGGKYEDFNATVDYSKVKLDKNNDAQLKDIIYKARTARGDRPESIDRYYNLLKSGDTDNDALYEEAELELGYLIDKNKADLKAKQDIIDKQKDMQLQQDMELWGVAVEDNKIVDLNKPNSIYNKLVKQRELKLKDKTYKIPDKIKVVENGKAKLYTPNEVFEYLYVPVTVNINGQPTTMTKYELDKYNADQQKTIDDELFEALRLLTGYDDSQFINEQVNNEKVNKIRKLRSKSKRVATGENKGSTQKKKKIVIKTK